MVMDIAHAQQNPTAFGHNVQTNVYSTDDYISLDE